MNELAEIKKTKIVKHAENPFLEGTITTIKTRKKRVTVAKGGTIIDNTTGEATAETVIAQVIEVDDGQFIKLFTKDIQVFFDLTQAGLKTFGLVLNVLQDDGINRDKIFIHNQDEKLKKFNLSRTVFFRGIDELISKKFLAKTINPNWYFINPALFFNGDRCKFVKEYRKKMGAPSLDDSIKYNLAFNKAKEELGAEASLEKLRTRAAEILGNPENPLCYEE